MEQQPRLPLWFLVANWALILGAFFLGVKLGANGNAPARLIGELPQPQLEALAIVHREILKSHIDPQQGEALLENAIRRMVGDLDPYSRYVPPVEVARYEEDNTGHYEGIGADFATHGDEVVLHFPLAGSPAERAGLRPGDVLLAVDGKALDDAQVRSRVFELVRGPAGTTVQLRLRRGSEQLDLAVERGDVQRPCIKWAHRVPDHDGVAYLRLTDFHPGASEQLLAALERLAAEGPLRGLVLDLRWNGGGSLDECVAIARAFLADGLIVSQTRRDREVVERHEAEAGSCRWPELPLSVLVNQQSASASEVLAGALQDHGRAAIAGVRTHGKGCVNTVYTWKEMPFRLKLTTGRYRTPSGRDIERNHRDKGAANGDAGGIAPDVEVPLTKEQERALVLAQEVNEPPRAWRADYAALATRLGATVPLPPTTSSDPQLARAIQALAPPRRADAATITTVDRGEKGDKDK